MEIGTAGRSTPARAATASTDAGSKDVTKLLDSGRRTSAPGGEQATAGVDAIGDRPAPVRTEPAVAREKPTIATLIDDVKKPEPAVARPAVHVEEGDGRDNVVPPKPPAATDPLKPLPEGGALADPVLDERIARAEESATSAEAATTALDEANDRLAAAERDGNPGLAADVREEVEDLETVAKLALEEARANLQMAERYAQVTYGIDLGDLDGRRGFAEDLQINDITHRVESAEAHLAELTGEDGPTAPPIKPAPPELPELPEFPEFPDRPEWPDFPGRPVPMPMPLPPPDGPIDWGSIIDDNPIVPMDVEFL
jgi:hypothetical protein